MASADFSPSVGLCCQKPARTFPKPKEISQGKMLILRSVAAGFTNVRVRMTIRHPRP